LPPAWCTASVIGRNATGHDQADTAGGAFGIKRRHAGEAVFHLFQADVHRAHQNPVGQGGEAQIERGQKRGISRHAMGSWGGCGRDAGGQLCNQLQQSRWLREFMQLVA
jgi:hypothetical protein